VASLAGVNALKLGTKLTGCCTFVQTSEATSWVTRVSKSVSPIVGRRSSVEMMNPDSVATSETARTDTTARDRRRFILEKMRVLIVGGIPAGVVIVGMGSRVAMFILRITSPSSVRGVESDDGFTIGSVTLGGTYNLLHLGAVVGLIGACAYVLVAPWLIGPVWFRRFTTGVASAVVAGSMLVHADGIDFNLLKPKWLAIGLFVALPGLFGALIGASVDRVARPNSWTTRGPRRWLIPLLAVVFFPGTAFVLPFALAVVTFWSFARDVQAVQRVRNIRAYSFAVRGLWLFIAVLGLLALINDIDALT
jgi:hypothetical protein